jgi:hypothetical protein
MQNKVSPDIKMFDDVSTEMAFTSCMTRKSDQYLFENKPEQINSIAQFLCRDLGKAGFYTEKQPLQVSLIEAINNAIFHRNLELSSKIKILGDRNSFRDFLNIARQRMQEAPYWSRRVHIGFKLDHSQVFYLIRDEGSGFDSLILPDLKDPETFQKPSGRGLMMIRSLCDEVCWDSTGSEITLVKYREINAETE